MERWGPKKDAQKDKGKKGKDKGKGKGKSKDKVHEMTEDEFKSFLEGWSRAGFLDDQQQPMCMLTEVERSRGEHLHEAVRQNPLVCRCVLQHCYLYAAENLEPENPKKDFMQGSTATEVATDTESCIDELELDGQLSHNVSLSNGAMRVQAGARALEMQVEACGGPGFEETLLDSQDPCTNFGESNVTQDMGNSHQEIIGMMVELPKCRLCVAAIGTLRCLSCHESVCGNCAGQDMAGRVMCKYPCLINVCLQRM